MNSAHSSLKLHSAKCYAMKKKRKNIKLLILYLHFLIKLNTSRHRVFTSRCHKDAKLPSAASKLSGNNLPLPSTSLRSTLTVGVWIMCHLASSQTEKPSSEQQRTEVDLKLTRRLNKSTFRHWCPLLKCITRANSHWDTYL